MKRIEIDTVGPLPNDMGFKYIDIVIIDTFTRYVELYPSKLEVTAIAAADSHGVIRASSQLIWRS